MSGLYQGLLRLHEEGRPIHVGLIGAGKFGSMFISQIHRTKGMHLLGIADLSTDRAEASLARVDFPSKPTKSLKEAYEKGTTALLTNSAELMEFGGLDVVIEATGNPVVGIRHALLACQHKKHIVMVNVEADVLAGPLLARKAKEAGIIYSMAYGDQPVIICELVDWARTAGFDIVCAGKGTKHLPKYHESTPDTVWDNYGFTKEQLATGDFNPQMFNSFLDGTKSALEMAAVSNACDLEPPSDGLLFPPSGADDLPGLLKPKSDGGVLERKGTVEVVSCLNLDGSMVNKDLRFGVYVVIEAPGPYQKDCFAQYGLRTDDSGRYAAQYKPYHLIGLELGVSVANIMIRGEATGSTKAWRGDVVATAKKDLKAGEKLDGEGGFTVYGKLVPARDSVKIGALPIGLAHGLVLKNDIPKAARISWDDVHYDGTVEAIKIRRDMEEMFRLE